MKWNRMPTTGALVCSTETCLRAAEEDERAAFNRSLGEEAVKLIQQAIRETPLACAYCGVQCFELHKADAERRRERLGRK